MSALRDILLIVFSLIAPHFFGVTGVFWAAPLADILAMAVTAVVMFRLLKKLNQLEQNNVKQIKLP